MTTTVETIITPVVFPYVVFTNTEGKQFDIARDRILHYETYERDGVLDPNKTFVNFKSPNHKSKGSLHAVVDMPVDMFRTMVMRPAYEGSTDTTR